MRLERMQINSTIPIKLSISNRGLFCGDALASSPGKWHTHNHHHIIIASLPTTQEESLLHHHKIAHPKVNSETVALTNSGQRFVQLLHKTKRRFFRKKIPKLRNVFQIAKPTPHSKIDCDGGLHLL